MNKNSMNWGQYNTRHVIKHVTLKFNDNIFGWSTSKRMIDIFESMEGLQLFLRKDKVTILFLFYLNIFLIFQTHNDLT